MKRIREENKKKELKRSKAGHSKKLFLEQDDDSASDISISELVDESRDKCEESASGNVLQLDVVENAVKGDYVIVEFAKKKHKCYYVGQVVKDRDGDNDIEVDFFRRKGGHFIKPMIPDICSVSTDDVKSILAEPSVCGMTQRTKGEIIFTVEFGKIDIC